jgi:WD40 repeat protein/serine/threonine protein kinase/transposase-like protein
MAQATVTCPNCKTHHQVDERALGRRGRCKSCDTHFVLTAASDTRLSAQGDTPASFQQAAWDRSVQVTVTSGVAADGRFRFRCPQCQRRLKVTPQQTGHRIDCPNCQAQLTVPSPDQAESPQREPRGPFTGGTLDADSVARKAAAAKAAEDGVAEVWNVGDVILDLYEVKRFSQEAAFAEGGFGRVNRVHHRTWNLDLAVKSPRPGLFRTDKQQQSFIRECETWMHLGLHPNTVSCHYVRMLGGIPRVFAEFVEGGNLKDWITQGRTGELKTALDIAIQIAWGMAFAHSKGLVHRDLKPVNVLMTRSGIAKVTDFGLARHGVTSGEAIDGRPAGGAFVSTGSGTLGYGAPEQWSAGRPVDHRADIFSFGATLWRMLDGRITWADDGRKAATAKHAVGSQRKRGERAELPAPLVDLILRCLEPEPEDRWADLSAVAEQLKQIYAESIAEAYPRPEPRQADALADSLNNQALSLLDLGKTQEAEQAWQGALKLDSMHLDSVYNYGLFQWRRAEIDDVTLVKRVREAGAGDEPWHAAVLAAQVELERDDCQAAITVLKALDAQDAERADVQVLLTRARSLKPTSRRCLRTFEAHTACVNSVFLSADGGRALSGGSDTSMRLWGLAAGKCSQVFREHMLPVNAVCLSADARLALSGSADKTLKLWEVGTGKCRRTFEGHKTGEWANEAVNSVWLSSNGEYALSGSTDKKLKLWKVGSGECVRTFSGHKGEVNSVRLSGDTEQALSGSTDKTLKLWKVSSGECLATLEGHADLVNSVCLSRDGDRALSGSSDKTVILWDVASRRPLRTIAGHLGEVLCVCLSSDSRFALSASSDKTLKLWDLETGRCLRTFQGHTGSVVSACLGADGRRAVSGGEDRTLRLWELAGNTIASAPWEVSQPVDGTASSDAAARFSQGIAGVRAALGSGDTLRAAQLLRHVRGLRGYRRHREGIASWGQLYLQLPKFALADGWQQQSLEGHAGTVTAVCLSLDGGHALSASSDKTLRLWELASGTCVRSFEGHAGFVDSACLSLGGRYALSGGSDKTLKFWRVEDGKCLRTSEGHSGPVESVFLSADSRHEISGSSDATLKLWDVKSGYCLRTFQGHVGSVNSVALSLDGRYVLSGSSDTTVKVWSVSTGACLRTFEGHTSLVSSVCFSLDGRQVLSGSWDTTLKLWDVCTGACLRTFAGHARPINSVCMSLDGRYALSGSSDATVRLWDAGKGKCLRIFEGHGGAVNSVCLAFDGRYALSGGDDKTLRLYALDWDLEDKPQADWDEAARPYLELFLSQQTPWGGSLPSDRKPSEQEIELALTRRGKPTWNDAEFQQRLCRLLLSCGGYGWLRPQGVRAEVERMSSVWEGPSLRVESEKPQTRSALPGTLPPQIEVQGIKFQRIPAGKFLMGSPDSDGDAQSEEKPQHLVRITRPFYLGVYPVTQSQYEALMGSNPSGFQGDGNRPVEQASWEDANTFCRKLSEAMREKWRGFVCRLPTEAEWEFACRAGTSTRYCFGEDAARLGEYAWFRDNASGTTHPVGQKKPNAWGLYDMHGNVWEWCQDLYDEKYYAGSQVDDPAGPTQASRRVFRGGCWFNYAWYCRSANRDWDEPAFRINYLGFRVALVPPGK